MTAAFDAAAAVAGRTRYFFASDITPSCARGFASLLGDLGVASEADRRRRAQEVHDYLPRLREVKDAILAATPSIHD
jgi:hypothetical protein